LSFIKLIHKRTNVCGSATKCKTGSGRPKVAQTPEARMLFVICDAFNVLSCLRGLQPTTTSFELR